VAAISDPELLTHHAGWVLTTRYAQHVSSLLQEVTATGAHLRLHLEECAGQVKAKNHAVKNIQKGNRELLQKKACLEMRIKELNNELMRTYCSRDFKTDDLDDLETELHERDEQLEVGQAQATDLQHEVEHLQELIHPEPEEPEEDPEEIESMSSVNDD
jgi:chromosome segregation ATPase